MMDLQDYWNEYRIIEATRGPTDVSYQDEDSTAQEGECAEEREWLEAVGLSGLTEAAFLSGRELTEAELRRAVGPLSRDQAAAVRRRVHRINATLRRKPHVRDLFRDLESCSTDSRSRSATPDSLDSDPPSPPSPPDLTDSHLSLRFSPGLVQRVESKRRPVPGNNTVLPHHALFRRASRLGSDIVASETAEGITMVGYQRIGTVRVRERTKSDSDPINLNKIADNERPKQHTTVCVTRSHDSLFDSRRESGGSSPRSDTPGFEEMWAGDSLNNSINNNDSYNNWEDGGCGRTRVDFLAEEDLATLHPLLFLELSALMDQCGIRVSKIKPPKRKRKEDGALFGLSLSSLLERDQQIISEPHSVPLVFQKILGELERRGVTEEGVLRVGANQQRVEALAGHLEREFYPRPELADHLLASATVHELTTLLKRLIRLLPHPILTSHLVHLFYQAHGVPDCFKALNLLVLLLPTEHRATLHALLGFLSNVVSNQDQNKMSAHNVAMIMAPSLFPPNVLLGKTGVKAQELGMAVESCRLAEYLLTGYEKLWLVPGSLVSQLRAINQTRASNRKENVPSIPPPLSVHAPQFLHRSPVSLGVDKASTAADIILRVVEMARDAPRCVKSTKRDIKSRALSELAPNGNLSCLLSTGDPDTALQTHFLYEVGGNIGQRRLEQSALVMAVYQSNPSARWVVRCDHRNGSHRILNRS